MEYVVQTHELHKKYGVKHAVNGVDMNVRRGDIYGLIGRNGAGKTSLMKLVLGLTFPTSGKIELFGGESPKLAGKRIGSLIEEPALYRNCSARENMKRFSILFGADERKNEEILRLVRLEDTGKKPVKAFSQGMKQRLGIAVAMIGDPELMILDEPINGLDPTGIKEIRDVILSLSREKGVTFIISSHLLDELAKVVTCYGIINDGLLVEEISAEELRARLGKYIRIRVNDTESALNLIKTAYPEIELTSAEGVINISGHNEDTAKINALLVKGGVAVSEISREGKDFEEFFIERLGEER